MRGLVPVYDQDTKELICVVDNLTADEIKRIGDEVSAMWVEADEQGWYFDALNDPEKGLKARLQYRSSPCSAHWPCSCMACP